MKMDYFTSQFFFNLLWTKSSCEISSCGGKSRCNWNSWRTAGKSKVWDAYLIIYIKYNMSFISLINDFQCVFWHQSFTTVKWADVRLFVVKWADVRLFLISSAPVLQNVWQMQVVHDTEWSNLLCYSKIPLFHNFWQRLIQLSSGPSWLFTHSVSSIFTVSFWRNSASKFLFFCWKMQYAQ